MRAVRWLGQVNKHAFAVPDVAVRALDQCVARRFSHPAKTVDGVRQDARTPGNREEVTVAKHSGRLELTWTDKDKTLLSAKADGERKYLLPSESDVNDASSPWSQR